MPGYLALLAVLYTTAADPSRAELYFELKWQLRGRHPGTRIAVDQWAGGRLLMGVERGEETTRFSLIRPIEDPWTFRWYLTRDEVKLGAAVSVEDPKGDPYDALVPLLRRKVDQKYESWWDADGVESTAPATPPWSSETSRFWSEQHATELDQKDPLPEHPLYPFHVLGPPRGRLRFAVRTTDAGPGVVADSIEETMSGPWLRDGWQRWLDGERPPGYGYWEQRPRPRWEPRTYQTLAAALALLARPPDTAGRLSAALAALSPRTVGNVRFECPAEVVFNEPSARRRTAAAELGGCRVWRYVETDPAGRPLADEIQVLVERASDPATKLWIKVGYSPVRSR